MYTQCPKCETVFHITMEHLQAHGGLVRCGHCDHVFNADQRLFDEIPGKAGQQPAAPTKKPRTGNAKSKSIKPKAAAAPDVPVRKPARQPKKPPPETITEEVDAAPAPWAAAEPIGPKRAEAPRKSAGKRADQDAARQDVTRLDAILEQLPLRAAPRQFSSLWIVGGVLLMVALVAQGTYFYRDQLAAYPELRPYLIDACAEIGCTLRPPYDTGRIELVQPTNIAPHPRYANALRLRATLVNRAGVAQPQPLMQVTLTDSAGRVLSRRTFAPAQYLEQRAAAGTDMSPHLAIGALLDLANPDGKAVGYQIDFFSPPLH